MNNNDNQIMVSIICTAYNHEKYIRDTLEGFVSQKTDFLFEVLINDDASTDQTATIIREYEAKYPNIIKPIYQNINQYSQGENISLKFLFPRANGKYFAWCEGDDYWCDEYKLQKQYDIMENHLECSICTHKVRCINENGSINKRVVPESFYKVKEGVQSDYDIATYIWKGGYPFHTSSFFVRRSALYEYLNGDVPYIRYFNGDQTIIRSALMNGHFWYINEEMSRRRLWSIGNYNSRFLSLSDVDKNNIAIKELTGEIIYDEYTDGRFHEWIMDNISNRLVSIWIKDRDLMENTLSKFDLDKKYVLKRCTISSKLKYIVSCYFPCVIKILLAIKNYKIKGHLKNKRI